MSDQSGFSRRTFLKGQRGQRSSAGPTSCLTAGSGQTTVDIEAEFGLQRWEPYHRVPGNY